MFLNWCGVLTLETQGQAEPPQDQLAERLGEIQSFVSKCERGERRIGIADRREFCLAMDTTLPGKK